MQLVLFEHLYEFMLLMQRMKFVLEGKKEPVGSRVGRAAVCIRE